MPASSYRFLQNICLFFLLSGLNSAVLLAQTHPQNLKTLLDESDVVLIGIIPDKAEKIRVQQVLKGKNLVERQSIQVDHLANAPHGPQVIFFLKSGEENGAFSLLANGAGLRVLQVPAERSPYLKLVEQYMEVEKMPAGRVRDNFLVDWCMQAIREPLTRKDGLDVLQHAPFGMESLLTANQIDFLSGVLLDKENWEPEDLRFIRYIRTEELPYLREGLLFAMDRSEVEGCLPFMKGFCQVTEAPDLERLTREFEEEMMAGQVDQNRLKELRYKFQQAGDALIDQGAHSGQ